MSRSGPAAEPRRRLLAPEVVQSSAMDCGPAALKCLLEGLGVEASYDRLREACQTDVDGTSIDTLEQVAGLLGLEAEQVMVPVDHLLLPEAANLPALVVVRNAIGATHFVVVWRRLGPWLQVMDPATGRRWTTAAALLEELYVHAMPVPAAAWRQWAGSDDFLAPLERRLERLGVGRALRRQWIAAATAESGWHRLGTLDACVRLAASLVDGGAVRRGREATAVVTSLLEAESDAEAPMDEVPPPFWSVRPTATGDGEEPHLLLVGAVLLRVRGRRAEEAADARETLHRLSPDLAAALEQRPVHPLRALVGFLGADGRRAMGLLSIGFAAVAVGKVLEILLFRGLLDLGIRLTLGEQRLLASIALLLFLAAVLLLEFHTTDGALRAGRKVELRLRVRFLDKLANLGDRYFHSRLHSDMAERCHSVHRLRLSTEMAGYALRSGFQLLFLVAGIVWIDPGSALPALLSAGLTIALPVFVHPALAERDLRMRNHGGALSRFYLDALLGLVPLRAHAAGEPVRREHEGLLREWFRATLGVERVVIALDVAQSVVGYGCAVWILFRHLWGGSDATEVLLLAYWALAIPMRGQELAILARQVPKIQNTSRRLLEPLSAPDEELGSGAASAGGEGAPGVGLELSGVRVVAAGHRILDGLDLALEPGSQVAVVGPSGAGKSSLMGLFLGWHRPAAGELRVDGDPLSPARLEILRTRTAWVDPAVQLWNRPLLDNLTYGAGDGAPCPLTPVLDAASLRELLEALPDGWQTALGEGGALVSGGEGQRVRLARGLLRRDARLVILDEPFRGLDRGSRRRLLARARRWWSGATLFCITHDVGETLGFDRVLVLDGGRVVEDGEPGALAAESSSRYAAMLAAERRARELFATATYWRHLHLANGRLTEPSRPGEEDA